MRIWVIGRNYPCPENGMVGSFEYEQAKMLADVGHDVVYLALRFHPYKRIKKWGWVSFRQEGVLVCATSHHYAPERMYLHLPGYQGDRWEAFLEHVENVAGTPDVIHVHYPTMITIAHTVLAFKNNGKTRVICTEHWSRVLTKQLDIFQMNQLRQYVDSADHFICVGQTLKQSVLEITHSQKEIEVIPNVVDAIFEPASKPHSGFTFVASGRIVPVKQFSEMVDAFAKAFPERKDIHLIIIGDGSERRHLTRLIEKHGLREQVIMKGALKREAVAEIVSGSDCLICFSRLETFGVPVIEAWACGLPVITTTNGLLEDWDDRLGVLVKSNDIHALVEAMLKMERTYCNYDRDYISQYAQAHYSEKVIVDLLEKLYGE